jgi:hypothetical protein
MSRPQTMAVLANASQTPPPSAALSAPAQLAVQVDPGVGAFDHPTRLTEQGRF